jgi:hypothetical protein
MPTTYNIALVIAACLSGVAAMLHVGIVVRGPQWYRFFGAGERMASAAAAGRWYPAVVTLGIAAVLALWSAYALAGAGVIQALPLLKLGLSSSLPSTFCVGSPWFQCSSSLAARPRRSLFGAPAFASCMASCICSVSHRSGQGCERHGT